ncbi:MAG: response regulator transcription factor [Clostridiales bacterium]|nr:response regulator transcription factor [Clostridiales bacterium]
MRILIAEDERDLNHIISKKLTSDGYSVDSCFDGREAIDILSYTDYDAVILDIMMPGADGFAVLQALRRAGKSTPVLFLTARDSIADRVKGLDSGANDYLVKPFSFEELGARLRTMIRVSHGSADSRLVAGDLILDCAAKSVTRNGREIPLSAKEYALLEYMMHNRNRILSREQIENHIWNYDYEGGTNVVDVYISYLRRKIDGGQERKLIHTVRGRGYVLRADTQPPGGRNDEPV